MFEIIKRNYEKKIVRENKVSGEVWDKAFSYN
jgi:hypothetical protein